MPDLEPDLSAHERQVVIVTVAQLRSRIPLALCLRFADGEVGPDAFDSFRTLMPVSEGRAEAVWRAIIIELACIAKQQS